MEKGKPLGFETNVQSDQVARNWLEMATTDKTLTVILLTEKCWIKRSKKAQLQKQCHY